MTPFATLGYAEKSARIDLSKGVAKGLDWAGGLMRRSGAGAKQVARKGVFDELGGSKAIASQADRLAMRDMTAEAAKGVGNKRMAMAGGLDNAATAVTNSPGMQKAINYGGGAAVAGAGLYGANRMGRASGFEDGVGQGLDAGMQAGVESSMAAQNQSQPGYLGGLWGALQGQAGGEGFRPGVAYGDLSNRRGEIMNRLMMSYA